MEAGSRPHIASNEKNPHLVSPEIITSETSWYSYEYSVGGISASLYGAGVRPMYRVSQWRKMTQGCNSNVASSRM